MNSKEQISLLRRACECAADLDDTEVCVHSFHAKWRNPEDVRDADEPRDILRRALAATATPPDDAAGKMVEQLTKERDEALAQLDELRGVIEQHHNGYGETGKALGMKKPDSHSAALRELLEEQADISHREALEMIAAAKPEPSSEFDVTFPTDANGVEIPTVVRLTVKTKIVTETIAECPSEEVAKRIADALNAAGGGK